MRQKPDKSINSKKSHLLKDDSLIKNNKKSTRSKKDVLLSRSQLKDRGWTESIIKKFLPEPDMVKKNPIYSSAAPMKLYNIEKVKRVEKNIEFKRATEKSKIRSEKMTNIALLKKNKLLEEIDKMEFSIKVIPVNMVLANSIESYNEFHEEMSMEYGHYNFKPVNANADSDFLERIEVNYIRHNLTEYDRELEEMAGKIGVNEAVIKIKNRILDSIAKKYPELREQCLKQKKE